MSIIWRLPWSELLLLLVGVWLCLALEPNAKARLSSDRLVFPSESQPKLESRLEEIEREMAKVLRLTNVTLLMMQQEAKKEANPTEEQINAITPRSQTHPDSESRIITFGSEPESNSQRPWEETEIPATNKTKVVLEPRVLLETSKKCPESFILINSHCRKEA